MRRAHGSAAIAAAASLLALALAGEARGDEPTDVEALLEEPVLSTVSKSAETESSAPATTTTITAEELRRFGIRTLDEAINYLSLGMVTQNPLHSREIGARGVLLTGDFGNHVLLLLNGHTLNDQWAGTAYFDETASAPIEIIDHVELILGPGSVLYGSNAMLGVINIITKRAKDFTGARVVVEGQVPTAIRVAAGAGYQFKILGAPAEVTAEVEYAARGGPTFHFAPQPYGLDAVTGLPKRFTATGPATGVWGGDARASVFSQIPAAYVRAVAGPFQLSLRAATARRGNPYFNNSNTFPLDFDEPSSYERDRWLSLDLAHDAALSPAVSLRSRLYGDLYDYQQRAVTSAAEDCPPTLSHGCTRLYTGVARWMGLEEQATFDWLKNGRLVTLLGVDARVRHVGSGDEITDNATERLAVTRARDQRNEHALAVYAQLTGRPVRWLGLNGGGRFEVDERFGSNFSPRAAITVTPWAGATLKAIYAVAFRAPTSYESFIADPSQQVQAVDLRPEITRTIEALFEQRLGTHRVMAGVFRSDWHDMVLLESLGAADVAAAVKSGKLRPGTESAVQYRNVADIDGYGFDATFEGSLLARRLRYGINVTGAFTRRTQPGEAAPRPLTVAPQLFGNARASFDFEGRLPTLAIAAQLAGARPADRADDGGFTPRPQASPFVELRATISGPAPGIPGLSYRLSGDVTAASHAPYVVGPIQAATPQQPSAALAPVERYRLALGLQYDLPF